MNIKRIDYEPQGDSEPTYADAICQEWREGALADPMGAGQLHDVEIVKRRSRLERSLPQAPDAGRNLFDKVIEQGEASGAIRRNRREQT